MPIQSDELAFANEQLAGMLKSGLPLEGSLRELAGSMERGPLRAELVALEKDLAAGTPLADALERRDLPRLYKKMLHVGAEANNLPSVLQWLADHYARAHTTWLRLKGLMVYPMLVLLTATALSFGVAWSMAEVLTVVPLGDFYGRGEEPVMYRFYQWAPPVALMSLTLIAVGLLASPGMRRNMVWRLPAFREASLARVAGAMAMLLRSGCTLGESLALVRELEADNAAGAELAEWSERLERGEGKPEEFAQPGKVFPPLFTWVLRSGGEDLAAGFERAADLYHARQTHRTDAFLFAALPMAVLALGLLIMVQVIPVMMAVTGMMDRLSA
ncbi:MAG: type II secretion system F family protein [Verrucomicrobia subdivision 3 bacterium]|nr:type II secretion system F family protein [Limisphaerales bacterium]